MYNPNFEQVRFRKRPRLVFYKSRTSLISLCPKLRRAYFYFWRIQMTSDWTAWFLLIEFSWGQHYNKLSSRKCPLINMEVLFYLKITPCVWGDQALVITKLWLSTFDLHVNSLLSWQYQIFSKFLSFVCLTSATDTKTGSTGSLGGGVTGGIALGVVSPCWVCNHPFSMSEGDHSSAVKY